MLRRPTALPIVLVVLLPAADVVWSQTSPAPESASQSSLPLFDQVWERFAAVYPSFELKGVDWDAFGDRHRPSFDARLDPQAFAERLANALAELRDQHVWVQTPDGAWVPVYSPDIRLNFTSFPRFHYATAGLARLGDVIWHGWLVGEVGYVRVDTFDRAAWEGLTEVEVAAVLGLYEDARGLIVDVRPNAGGDETFGGWIAGHFTREPRVYGLVRYREGDGLGPQLTKTLEPRPEPALDLPTVVLIGEQNMSSAEWFILMMTSCPRVTTIGDATRGSSGNPEWLELANGVRVAIPRWIAYRPDGVPLEGHGVEPSIAIDDAASFDGSREYVIERALQELRAL